MISEILRDLSLDRVWEHILKITEISPERLSGTEVERKVAEYIRDCFESFAIDFKLYELDGFVSFPKESELKILEPEEMQIPSATFAQISSTPAEGIEGELVYVGAGGQQDYEGNDANGKITLAELSYSPPRPEKVRIAAERGAIGQIQINWGLPEHDCLPKGTVKAIWGNPTLDNFSLLARIPVIGIKRKDGEWLIEKLKQGKVKVRLKAFAERKWEKILLPLGRIEGQTEPKKFIIVGGHYDAWANGVTCNAVGNAETIEIAKVFSKHRHLLKRTLLFAFWPGHETGIMEGSSWFVDNFWDDLSENCVIYLNLDSTGLKEATKFIATTSPEIYRFHEKILKELLHYDVVEKRLLARTGDQSFFGIGIPSIYGRHYHSEETIKKWHGATLGWWYHSDLDTIDRVDKQLLSESLHVHAAYAAELAICPLLPFEFLSVVDLFIQRLRELEKISPPNLKISPLLVLCESLKEKIELLSQKASTLAHLFENSKNSHQDDYRLKLDMFNDTYLGLSRILTPELRTISGKYSQDSYGLSALSKMIPSLYPLEQMAALSQESDEYKLLWTKMIRERNRITDSLKRANALVEKVICD